jgi:translocation and assembly module TamB
MIKKIGIRVLKIVGWIAATVVALVLVLTVVIQIPSVQNKIVHKAISFMETKIGTRMSLSKFSLQFPKTIVLTGLYLEDQKRDTLLYAKEISVNTDLWQLLHHRIQLNDVSLKEINAKISRPANDSTFNFNYIIEAFTSDSVTTPKDTTSSVWKFSLYNLEVNKAHLQYSDLYSGNRVQLKVNSLEVSMDEIDLDRFIFQADRIALSDVNTFVVQTTLPSHDPPSKNKSDQTSMNVGFQKLDLKNIHVKYSQQALGQIMQVDVGAASSNANVIDLINQKIDLDNFSLVNSFISYQQMAGHVEEEKQKDTIVNSPAKPWNIKLDALTLNNNAFQFYDFNKPFSSGIDFNHLWITAFNAQAKNIKVNGNDVEAALTSLTLYEKSGFSVNRFETNIALTNNTADIEDFILETNHSKISATARAKFNSLDNIAKEYQYAKVNIMLDKTYLSMRDILYWQPHAFDSIPLKDPAKQKVYIDAKAHGFVNDLDVDNLTLRIQSKTIVKTKGSIKGLPDFEHAVMNMSLDKFYTTEYDVKNILQDTLLPKALQFPKWLNVKATLAGTMKAPVVRSITTSDVGEIALNANMDLDSTSVTQGYKGNISIKDLNVGSLLKEEQTIGKLTMTASLKGTGTDMKSLNAFVDIVVNNFQYQGYKYENFKLNGSVKQYFFTGTAFLKDENLDFNLKGNLDYNHDTPSYRFKFELINADFKALHLSERPLKARGTLEVDLATADFKVINGFVDIRKVAVFNGQKLYTVDSLLFASVDQEGKTEINIDSDLFKGNFSGNVNLFSMPDVLKQYFNTYFSLKNVAQLKKPAASQNFKFDLELKKSELITDILVPELVSFEPGPIHGEFNSVDNDLSVRVSMGKIQYNNIAVDSFLLNLNSSKRSLNYDVFLENIRIDSLMIYGVEVDGVVAHDSIKTIFAIRDSLKNQQFKFGGVFYSREDDFQFKFLKNLVVLNYEHWHVPPDNYMSFGDKGLMTHNLSVSLDEQKIFIETKNDRDSTMQIGFRSLYLAGLSNMLAGNKTLVAGSLNGDVNILRAKKNAFDANVDIHGLTILRQLWGEVTVDVKRMTADRFDMKLAIDGVNTNIKSEGYYSVTPKASSIDFKTNISKFDLSLIEPLVSSAVSDLKGMLTGNINISGDLKKPTILGGITFKDTNFSSPYTNTAFSFDNETIKLSSQGFEFNNFKIKDVNKNVASINGTINTTSFPEMTFDLKIRTRNFRVLNTTENINSSFYGRVGLNANAYVTGTSTLPIIDLQLGLTDDSDFTYIVPQDDKGVLDQTGIVTFVDKDAINDPFLSSIDPKDTVSVKYSGIELTANIELTDKERFNIVIDPLTGDKLSVQGNTTLTFKMDALGNMDLTGRYEISKGSYNLSFYKLVKRNFEIEKGSTILWSGDPLNAIMDIRAIYRVETSPLELVSSQLSSQEEMNQYRQRVPFLVYLILKGDLLLPEISFKLDMPMDKRNAFAGNVYAKLQDINTRESDLNKQVFSLLLLKRFMADNPFESQSSGGLTQTARTSVSKILTEQLNRLSENVKGVQLTFDVKSYSDYNSSSGQTSLQLGLSKNLLNDRLVVKLSGNVDVEGENTNQKSFTDYIGDLALEYKMTPDGRLRVTGFRNSDYDMIDGELVRTGAGLIYIKDYNVFRELFRANAKSKDEGY